MNKSSGRIVRLRLFLEGIEVDVGSVTVGGGVNQPMTASISIPASSAATKFLPRTLAHVYYFDSGNALQADGVYRTRPDISDMRNWRLLFMGEAVSFRYVTAGAGTRQIELMCQGFSTYWEHAKLYWGGARGLSHHGLKRAIFAGASHVEQSQRKGRNTITNIIQRSPVTLPGMTGVLGGVISLLESCTGVYTAPEGIKKGGKSTKTFRGVNDFVSSAELRYHLTRMIGALPEDDTSAAFIESKSFKRYFARVSRALGSTGSYYQLASLLLQKVYHDFTSVPAPPYFSSGQIVTTKRQVSSERVSFPGNARLAELFKAITQARDVTGNRVSSRLEATRVSEPGVKNVDYILSREVSPGVVEPDTPGHAKYASAIRATGLLRYQESELIALGRAARSAAAGKGATANRKASSTAAGLTATNRAITLLKLVTNNQTTVAGQYSFHTSRRIREILRYLDIAKDNLSKVSSRGSRTVKRNVTLGDRVHAYLIKPDLYMAPPPRCNVIWPSQHSTVSYSRAWLNEPTRLWMHGRTKSGRDKRDIYFAPNINMVGVPGANTAVEAVKKGAAFLMPHEKYTGIVPVFKGLGDNDIFKKQHRREGSKAGGRAQGSPQAHLQRSANFEFFRQRFAARTMQVGAMFMPGIVPGLPALLLDPEVRHASITGDAQATHYVGTVHNVRHSINAAGAASTNIVMTKCRAHDEGLDLFADDNPGETVRKVRREVTRRLTGPDGQDFTAEYNGQFVTGYAKTDHITPDSVGGLEPRRGARYSIVAKDFRKDHGFGTDVDINDTADGHRTIIDREYNQSRPNETIDTPNERPKLGLVVEVRETRTVTNERIIKFSLEDTLTPPWFSQIYRSGNIGGSYYTPMLGCRSVVDNAEGFDPNEDSGTQTSEELIEEAQQRELLEAAGGNVTFEMPIKTGDGSEVTVINLPVELAEGSASTEQAADVLGRVWVALRTSGADVEAFVEAYGSRKFATMQDIMGTMNPDLLLLPTDSPPKYQDGVLGFHGEAYGSMTELRGLDGEPLFDAAVKQGAEERNEAQRISTETDPRSQRRIRVLDYARELEAKTGSSRRK
jgi:hypothetical protein